MCHVYTPATRDRLSGNPTHTQYDTRVIRKNSTFNPIRSGLFQTVNDPVGGFKSPPPPLRSRKLFCQSSPYHTCAFYQVF